MWDPTFCLQDTQEKINKISQEQIWTWKHWRTPRTAAHCSCKALQTWVLIIKSMDFSNTCPIIYFLTNSILSFCEILSPILSCSPPSHPHPPSLVFCHYLKSERIFLTFPSEYFISTSCQYTSIHGINLFR